MSRLQYNPDLFLRTRQYIDTSVAPKQYFIEDLILTRIGGSLDGGGSSIVNGAIIDIGPMKFQFTIEQWTVYTDGTSGNIVFDVRVADKGVFPPGGGQSIVGGGNAPALVSTDFAEATPSGWTRTLIEPDEMIRFFITGTPTVDVATVVLQGNKTLA